MDLKTKILWHTSEIDIPYIDIKDYNNLNCLFYNNEFFNSPIGKWDTSNVKYMESMFEGAIKFDQPLNEWNTSKVKNMSGMFADCTRFNRPLYKWNTSKVKTMEGMFSGAYGFNQDIGMWDVSRVKQVNSMFSDCRYFNQDLNKWNTSKFTNIVCMFYKNQNFNADNVKKWDLTNVVKFSHAFHNDVYGDTYIYLNPTILYGDCTLIKLHKNGDITINMGETEMLAQEWIENFYYRNSIGEAKDSIKGINKRKHLYSILDKAEEHFKGINKRKHLYSILYKAEEHYINTINNLKETK